MPFAIKAEIRDVETDALVFTAQKTMYGGKLVAAGDMIFLFASENAGGKGLVARGIVSSAQPFPGKPGIERQTPRVTLAIKCAALAKRSLGRAELRPFRDWDDGNPATELDFKLYRQATDKVVGISEKAVTFLNSFF